MSSRNHSALLRMMGVLFAVLGISFIPTVVIALIYGEYFEDFALAVQWQCVA